jgi:hypothetical protein
MVERRRFRLGPRLGGAGEEEVEAGVTEGGRSQGLFALLGFVGFPGGLVAGGFAGGLLVSG